MRAPKIKKLPNTPEFQISIFAFLLNFVWEQLQMPLFSGFDGMHYYSAVLHCTKATFGDVVISLVSFAGVSLIVRSRQWILTMDRLAVITFFSIGVIITVGFELLATGILNRWTYGELMPVIPYINIGISPIAQWIILPFFQLWFVRRQLIGSGFGA